MLFTASILILVHILVPHHHQPLSPEALVHSHCDLGIVHGETPAHTHHNGSPDETCLISEAIEGIVLRMLDDDPSIEVQMCLSGNLHSIFSSAIAVSLLPDVEPGNDISLPFRRRPYLSVNYTDAVVRTSGLRAPPVC